jgi:sugar/nucleoside kinase (ribokinase family)
MKKQFVSIGVTILDIVGHPIRQIPEGDSTELVESIQICPAGTAAAPAVVAARQGLETTLIGAVGNDDLGRFLRTKLQDENVKTDCLQVRDDMPTAATILPINNEGDRPNWHMPGAFLMLELDDNRRQRLVNADHIHWGGVGLLFNLDGDVGAELLAEAKNNGATISADLIAPGPHTLDSIAAIAKYLDYFMPSIDEALEIAATDNIADAAQFFIDLGVKNCVIKCGADGAYLAHASGIREQIPVISEVKVVDTSGCGDSFCGGFNVALAHGFEPLDACRFASATAAQVASGMGSGAGVVDFETTLKIMQAGSMTILHQEQPA